MDNLTIKKLYNIINEEKINLPEKGSGKYGKIVKKDLIEAI